MAGKVRRQDYCLASAYADYRCDCGQIALLVDRFRHPPNSIGRLYFLVDQRAAHKRHDAGQHSNTSPQRYSRAYTNAGAHSGANGNRDSPIFTSRSRSGATR